MSSLLPYLFDNDRFQRADIEALRERGERLARELEYVREASHVDPRLRSLQETVGQLALVNKVLLRMLLDKKVCTEGELLEMMRAVDREDGVADGKAPALAGLFRDDEESAAAAIAAPAVCAKCSRPLRPDRDWCIYCGELKNKCDITAPPES